MANLQRSDHHPFFWGKYISSSQYLPLAAHCLDVALVFRSLCELSGFRRMLICASDTPINDQQLDRLAVIAMLHDIGKANLGFQCKVLDANAPRAGHIKELVALFDAPDLCQGFMQALLPEFPTWFFDEGLASSYLLASFSHHGLPLGLDGEKAGTYWLALNEWWRRQGALDPIKAIQEIVNWSRLSFPKAFQPSDTKLPSDARFHHCFAGMVMLADWLGSDQARFPIENVQLDKRLMQDKETIPKLLCAVGLDVTAVRPVLRDCAQDFQGRFGFIPRPLQAAIDNLNPEDDNTRLVIAESETGSGKTEAALNWFFKLFMVGKVDSLYFALPTRVAARELYQRVVNIIERTFSDPSTRPLTVLAVPGYTKVDGKEVNTLPDDTQSNRWQDDYQLSQRERQWAAERPKRFLAATIAVGTIDQALLSTIQTSHAHLRSVCLDRSLLVVDEVHASDLYMSRLLESLLSHHISVGGRAILLSATLGAGARHRYVDAVSHRHAQPPDLKAAEDTPYPAMTLADGISRSTTSTPFLNKSVHFCLLPIAFYPEAVADHIDKALVAGARVIVILNTVDRVNELLRVLENSPTFDQNWLFKCQGTICPHHGRFAPEDREVLDTEVSNRLGPGSAGGPLLIIGTQTLEQSLDIDADLMISDLAPADVLLQRVGRLHRHQRKRPLGYEIPQCILLVPEKNLESALDIRGTVYPEYKRLGYGSVYEDLRALELTRRVLEMQPNVSIPADNRRLVEAVTHPSMLNSLTESRWIRYAGCIEGVDLAKKTAAGYACIDYRKYFGELQFNELGGTIATRLGVGHLQLPVKESFVSPFGQVIRELVIPDHLAPEKPEEAVTVESTHDGITILRCADRHYSYSRYGLEAMI